MGHPRRQWAAAFWAAGFVAVYFAWMMGSFGGERATQAFDDLGQLAAAAVACGACALAARRATRRTRAAWSLLAGACGAWAAGEAVWSVYEIVLRRNVPFPSLADVGFLAMVPLSVAAMLAFPLAGGERSRIRALLDGCIIAASMLFVSWALVLGPVYRASAGAMLGRVIGLAYPIGDVLTISIVVFVAMRARGRGRASLSLLAIGLGAISIADSGFAYLTAKSSYASGNVIDAGWVAGFFLVALAAFRPAGAPAADDFGEPTFTGEARIYLPYIVAALAIVAAALVKILQGSLNLFLFWTFLTVIVLVLTRQMLTLVERARLERQLQHQALHDPLTRLANRALFRNRVEHALGRLMRTHETFSVAFLDLDDFKTINDSLGHAAGDALLHQVAERLGLCVRSVDTVARLGGDEFALLLVGVDDPVEATKIVDRALSVLRAPFPIGHREVNVGASVGIAVCSSIGASADDLLANADMAMYTAKANGKSRVEVFQQSMHTLVLRRAEIQADLRRALEEDQLDVVFQPVVSLSSGGIVGAEALLRWQHPEQGDIPPDEFIGIAEESGLIMPIGWRVMRRAFAEAARWRSSGTAPWISVNISANQLQHVRLLDEITSAMTASGVDASSVVVEITETVLMRDTEQTIQRLNDLKQLGIRIAIDDFGTGYSSLSYLRYLPIDFLKIDASFVRRIDHGPEDAALAHAIVRLGTTLGLRTIAEGLENRSQARHLRRTGCDLGQGHLFAAPVSGAEFGAIFEAGLPLGASLEVAESQTA